MTDEQLELMGNAMVEQYGDLLPDSEHCPKEFAYYVKLFHYTSNMKEQPSGD